MTPQDWRDLASVCEAGERKTWGVHDAGTYHLGIALVAMARRCHEVAGERDQQEKGKLTDGPS